MKPAPIVKAANAAGVTVVTTNETVAVVLAGISTEGGGDLVELEGNLEITTGAGTTAVIMRIERGSVAGGLQVISDAAVQVTAGNTVNLSINATDNPGEVAGQSYVLTVLQSGATANGTVTQVQLNAIY